MAAAAYLFEAFDRRLVDHLLDADVDGLLLQRQLRQVLHLLARRRRKEHRLPLLCVIGPSKGSIVKRSDIKDFQASSKMEKIEKWETFLDSGQNCLVENNKSLR